MTASGSSSSCASRIAAAAAMPDEPPTSRASSRASRRVIANESLSETAMIRSATVAVVGRRPEVLADALDEVRAAGAA